MKKILLFSGLGIAFAILLLQLNFGGVFLPNEKQQREEIEPSESGADRQMALWFQSRAWPDPYYLSQKYERGWRQFQDLKNNNNSNSRL